MEVVRTALCLLIRTTSPLATGKFATCCSIRASRLFVGTDDAPAVLRVLDARYFV